MKRQFLQFAAISALAAGMAIAQAPATGSHPASRTTPSAHPGCARFEEMMQALDLTPQQRESAKTIFSDARQKAEPIRLAMRQNREALDAAVKANDTAQIERLATHQGELQGKALAIRSEARAKFYAMLTPEQRTKADQMHEEMRSRMRQRMEGTRPPSHN